MARCNDCLEDNPDGYDGDYICENCILIRVQEVKAKKLTKSMDIETRVTKSLAIGRYIRAMQRSEEAAKEFNEARQHVKEVLEKPEVLQRFITKYEYKTYLVTIDTYGSFDVEEIETL